MADETKPDQGNDPVYDEALAASQADTEKATDEVKQEEAPADAEKAPDAEPEGEHPEEVHPAVEAAQAIADPIYEQGYIGTKVDEAPNEDYTVAGVTKAANNT